MKSRALLIMLAVLWVPSASAGVYKWTDKNGRVHYGDAPPSKSHASEVRTPISSIKGPAVVSDFTPKAAPAQGTATVRMFTTQSCGYCRRAKAFLSARGTPYEELDVEASAAAYDEYKALGGRGVPVILVGNRRMSGFNQNGLEAMLRDAGL